MSSGQRGPMTRNECDRCGREFWTLGEPRELCNFCRKEEALAARRGEKLPPVRKLPPSPRAVPVEVAVKPVEAPEEIEGLNGKVRKWCACGRQFWTTDRERTECETCRSRNRRRALREQIREARERNREPRFYVCETCGAPLGSRTGMGSKYRQCRNCRTGSKWQTVTCVDCGRDFKTATGKVRCQRCARIKNGSFRVSPEDPLDRGVATGARLKSERVCHKCGKPSRGQYWCDKCRPRGDNWEDF